MQEKEGLSEGKRGDSLESQTARKARIRERTEKLYRAGWYDAQDGKTLMKWMDNGVPFAALEGILWLAEDDCRRTREVKPGIVESA